MVVVPTITAPAARFGGKHADERARTFAVRLCDPRERVVDEFRAGDPTCGQITIELSGGR